MTRPPVDFLLGTPGYWDLACGRMGRGAPARVGRPGGLEKTPKWRGQRRP